MTPPAVILSHPQLGENVGASARAMKNFGLSELILIAPKFEWPNDRAHMLASTARGRDVLKQIHTPQAGAERLRTAAHAGARTALLFGGERAGLDNDEM